MIACIRERRLFRSPFAVIDRIPDFPLLNKFFGLLDILGIEAGVLVDAYIDANRIRLTVVDGLHARCRKACPQSVEGIGLVITIYIGNGFVGVTNDSSPTVALFVHPSDKDMVIGRGNAAGHRKGVTFCETVVVVPLLGARHLGRIGWCVPGGTIKHQIVTSFASLFLIRKNDDVLRVVLADGQLFRVGLAVSITGNSGLLEIRNLDLVADLVARERVGVEKFVALFVYILDRILAVLGKGPGAGKGYGFAIALSLYAVLIPATKSPITIVLAVLINLYRGVYGLNRFSRRIGFAIRREIGVDCARKVHSRCTGDKDVLNLTRRSNLARSGSLLGHRGTRAKVAGSDCVGTFVG